MSSVVDLQLPPEVRPLWLDGVFASELERDTLPLLFATDRIFDEYYDALTQKNAHVSVALQQIRERNTLARQQCTAGLWQDCTESLLHCVHLRRCLFEETDFQYLAAQKHCLLTLVSFATYFLKKSDEPKIRDAMLMRAFELFKKAEAVCGDITDLNEQHFFRAYVENNFATYFAKRGKHKAGAQRMLIALKAWSKVGIRSFDLYFSVQKGAGECWSNRFESALEVLKAAMQFAPPADGVPVDAAVPAEVLTGDKVPPVRHSLILMSSPLPIQDAALVSLHYNIAVALIGLRRYKEAAPWCAEAMRLATKHSAVLKSSSPVVRSIHHTQAFCEKMSFSTRFADFRMKKSDYVMVDPRRQQTSVSSLPGASEYVRRKRQLMARGAADEAEDTIQDRPTPKPPARGSARTVQSAPRTAPPRTSSVDALRVYLTTLSYPELVARFGHDGRKKSRNVSSPGTRAVARQVAVEPLQEQREPPPPLPDTARTYGTTTDTSRTSRSSSSTSSPASSPPKQRSDADSREASDHSFARDELPPAKAQGEEDSKSDRPVHHAPPADVVRPDMKKEGSTIMPTEKAPNTFNSPTEPRTAEAGAPPTTLHPAEATVPPTSEPAAEAAVPPTSEHAAEATVPPTTLHSAEATVPPTSEHAAPLKPVSSAAPDARPSSPPTPPVTFAATTAAAPAATVSIVHTEQQPTYPATLPVQSATTPPSNLTQSTAPHSDKTTAEPASAPGPVHQDSPPAKSRAGEDDWAQTPSPPKKSEYDDDFEDD